MVNQPWLTRGQMCWFISHSSARSSTVDRLVIRVNHQLTGALPLWGRMSRWNRAPCPQHWMHGHSRDEMLYILRGHAGGLSDPWWVISLFCRTYHLHAIRALYFFSESGCATFWPVSCAAIGCFETEHSGDAHARRAQRHDMPLGICLWFICAAYHVKVSMASAWKYVESLRSIVGWCYLGSWSSTGFSKQTKTFCKPQLFHKGLLYFREPLPFAACNWLVRSQLLVDISDSCDIQGWSQRCLTREAVWFPWVNEDEL